MGSIHPFAHLQNRCCEPWLFGLDQQQLWKRTEQRYQELSQLHQSNSVPMVLLAEADPTDFLAGFLAACTAHCPVCLGNAHWTEPEWQQVLSLVQPDLCWGQVPEWQPQHLAVNRQLHSVRSDWILIATGGSSGQIRFAVHSWDTLTAAVQGFQSYFAVDQVNSCCLLPLYHVSGLMQFLRSFLSGGKLVVLPFKQIEQAQSRFDPTGFFVSLVPTQLQRLLQQRDGIAWLQRCQTILVGGAPAWPDLLDQARSYQLPLAPTYGMTETAAQVATLKPADFLQQQTGCGQPLPHVQIEIRPVDCLLQELYPEHQQNQADAGIEIGTVIIRANSLMLGYFPDCNGVDEFVTDDLGYFDRYGSLHLVARSSHKIITGGENVFPIEVEAAILATGLVSDVCVIGMPDQTWGEVVTAMYVAASEVTVAALQTALAPQLSKFKQPKQWISLDHIPRNSQGKVNYAQLKQFLLTDQTQTRPLLQQTESWVHDAPEKPPSLQ
jgi:o-succinylbenzoate---CoA ligase